MEDLIRYFTNLLILQYKNKPRAKATIETLTRNAFSDTQNNIFPIEVQNAYNLDTAVGKQLDVLGKYLGYDRILPIPIDNTFKFAEYDGSINPEQGYSEYNDNKTTYPYAEYRYSTYDYYYMDNAPYRKVLKMISYLKGKPLSLGNINDALDYAFNGDIYVVEKDKEIEYHLLKGAEDFAFLNTQDKLNMFFNKYFPRPTGCSLSAIQDPYYINAIPVGGAENHTTGTIFEMTMTDNSVYYKTPIKFNFKEYESSYYPNFHSFKVKIRVKIDSSTYYCGCWTTLSGDEYISENTGDLALVKVSSYIDMLTGKTDFRQIVTSSTYTGKWIDITLTLDYKKYGTHSVWAIVESEGVETQTVNTMWGTPDWVDFTFLYGIAYNYGLSGSIDFMGCSIEIDDEVKWKGYTNKRI